MSQNPNTDSKEEEAAKDKVTEKKKSYTDNQLLRMMINEQKDAKKLLTKINANLSFFVWMFIISLILSFIVFAMINS